MILQACLIGLVAVLSIGFASVVIEQFLVREALTSEAEHFWEGYDKDPSFQAPNTANLKGYLSEMDSLEGIPQLLQDKGLGFKKMHGQRSHSLMYNSEHKVKCVQI